MTNKKSTFSKKMKSYSALAGSVLAVSASADAQVIYTDVAPDSVVNASTGGFYDLDLNNDGVADFRLATVFVSSSSYLFDYVFALPLQGVNAIDTVTGGYAAALNAGVDVCASSPFVDSISNPFAGLLAANVTLPYAFTVGNFIGATGKFLGLRFTETEDTYYGWVRLNVAADAKSFTVIDYGCKNTIIGCSTTGLTTDVGIAESALANQVNIYAFEKNITVKLDPAIAVEGVVTVFNSLGQAIKKVTITNSEMVIPMETAITGMYLVNIVQATGSYTKRVSIK
jgi:hypothetical protein